MPANLPPQYYVLEREFKAERDTAEKLRLAKELLRMMPKHKGTDKLQAEMKAKISKLTKLLASGGQKGGGGGAARTEQPDHVEREGAGQVIIIGPPNSGKSSLLDCFTNAHPIVAEFPYSTREPQPGMMSFQSIQIQLVDTPPISPDLFETYLLGIIRNADLICLVAGLNDDDFVERLDFLVDKLKQRRIVLVGKEREVEEGGLSPSDVGVAYKKTIIAAHKIDDDSRLPRMEKLREIYPDFDIIRSSILDDESLENLQQGIYQGLNIIRVFTKTVGHDPDFKDPIILKPGASVDEAAFALHKDFARKLKFAKVWGEGKHDGQRVQKTFILNDGDIIEFHI